MMIQNWDGVPEFVTVVERGSFSEAASVMGVSRSHVSKKVKGLEERLGVELLHRTTRTLNLTSMGSEFFPKCQHLLLEMNEAQALLIDKAAKPQGTIRLTVAGAFGEEVLAPALADFATAYPDLSIDVEFTNRLVNLSEEQFDLAIRSGLVPEIHGKHEQAELLYAYQLLTVASPTYLKNHGRPESIAELVNHSCMQGSLPHWRFVDEGAIHNTVVQGRWRSNNGRALVQAALKGLGVIQVPHFYVQDALASHDLEEVLAGNAAKDFGYYAVVPAQQVSRRVSMLIEHLKESFARL